MTPEEKIIFFAEQVVKWEYFEVDCLWYPPKEAELVLKYLDVMPSYKEEDFLNSSLSMMIFLAKMATSKTPMSRLQKRGVRVSAAQKK